MIQRIHIQDIENIMSRIAPSFPLCHLHLTQIMRRIHIPSLPPPCNQLGKLACPFRIFHVRHRVRFMVGSITPVVEKVFLGQI